jgi:hypothetical protein
MCLSRKQLYAAKTFVFITKTVGEAPIVIAQPISTKSFKGDIRPELIQSGIAPQGDADS